MEHAILLIILWIARAHDLWRTALSRRRPLAGELAVTQERLAKLEAENDLLRTRLRRLEPRRCPRYRPWERLRILAHQARYGLSVRATAAAFVVAASAISRWAAQAREGASRLVRARRPMNALPDLVRELSSFLKREWPRWGSRRIAGILARLGIQASRSSVQRLLRHPPPRPAAALGLPRLGSYPRAQAPRQVYVVDFTRIGGLFRSLFVGVVIDLYSREVLAMRVCDREPTAAFACALLAGAIRRHGKPRRVLTDKGVQFTSDRFESTLRRRRIPHRFGAIGRPGLPTIDRFFRTMKDEFARALFLYRSRRCIQDDLARYASWYNGSRPHGSLKNRSPGEVFAGRPAPDPARAEAGVLQIKLIAGDRRLPVFGFRKTA
jgi:transposase InsO family protein